MRKSRKIQTEFQARVGYKLIWAKQCYLLVWPEGQKKYVRETLLVSVSQNWEVGQRAEDRLRRNDGVKGSARLRYY